MEEFKHTGSKVVLTEGKNDCHVILALCQHHSLPETFGFWDCGSDTQLLKTMSAFLVRSEPLIAMAVVLDADNPNLSSKWASIKGRLEKEQYTVPDTPHSEGSILRQEGRPTVGIWLMPNNNVDGMLEDFCTQLAPAESMKFSGECVKSAEDKGFSSFIPNHRSKAEIHTYLAWQDEPGRPLGQAITAKCLDPEHPIARQFADFLERVFS